MSALKYLFARLAAIFITDDTASRIMRARILAILASCNLDFYPAFNHPLYLILRQEDPSTGSIFFFIGSSKEARKNIKQWTRGTRADIAANFNRLRRSSYCDPISSQVSKGKKNERSLVSRAGERTEGPFERPHVRKCSG